MSSIRVNGTLLPFNEAISVIRSSFKELPQGVPPNYEAEVRGYFKRINADASRKYCFGKIPDETWNAAKVDTKTMMVNIASGRKSNADIFEKNKGRNSEFLEKEGNKANQVRFAGGFCIASICELARRYRPEDPQVFKLISSGFRTFGVADTAQDFPVAKRVNRKFAEDVSKEALEQKVSVETVLKNKIIQSNNLKSYVNRGKPTYLSDDNLRIAEQQTLDETKVVEPMGHSITLGPFSIEEAIERGVSVVAPRKNLQQQSEDKIKDRLIDPSCINNACVVQPTSVTIPAPQEILHAADVVKNPGRIGKNAFLSFTRKALRNANRWEKQFEVEVSAAIAENRGIDQKFFEKRVVIINECTGARAEQGDWLSDDEAESAKRRKLLKVESRPISLLIIDLWKMYSQFAVDENELEFNGIILWSLADKVFKVFIALSAVFGNVLSVFGAIRVGQAAVSFITRSLGIVQFAYVDDFVSIVPTSILDVAKTAVMELFRGIGLKFKEESRSDTKVKYGSVIRLLGLTFDVESDPINVSVPSTKRERLSKMIGDAIANNDLDHNVAKRIVGKCGHCLGAVTGRRFNCVLRPISRRQFESDTKEVTPLMKHSGHTLQEILKYRLSRTTQWSCHLQPVLLYTDASWQPKNKTGEICAVICVPPPRGSGEEWSIILARSSIENKHLIVEVRDHAVNYCEAIAPTWGCRVFKNLVSDKFVATNVDNNTAKASLLQSFSDKWQYNAAGGAYWIQLASTNSQSWISRVKSQHNVADSGTHADKLEFILKKFPELFSEILVDPEREFLLELAGAKSEFAQAVKKCFIEDKLKDKDEKIGFGASKFLHLGDKFPI